MNRKTTGLLALAFTATACAGISPEAMSSVRVTTDREETRECRLLGGVRSESVGADSASHAEKKLIQQTYDRGGNLLLLVAASNNGSGMTTENYARGDAYACPRPPVP